MSMAETGIGKELYFSLEEYQTRLAGLRTRMAGQDIDTLLVTTPENVYWLTGYQTIGYSSYQCVVVGMEGDPLIVVRLLEEGIARRTAWTDNFLTYADGTDPVTATVKAIGQLGLSNPRVGVEEAAWFLTVRNYRKLTEALGTLHDGSGLVEDGRKIKSAQEIEYIRLAARTTEAGMEAAAQAARPGVSENDIAAAAFDAMTRAGSEYMAIDPIVTSGPRSGIAHSTYLRRTIEPGDAILLEFGGCWHRYFGPIMRTVLVGDVPSEAERMTQVCIDALNAAIEAIKPGVTSHIADKAARDVIDEFGFTDNYRKRLGYSVGVGFAPDWGEGHIIHLNENDPMILEPGMVFHMPPALRRYGQWGVGMSETVLVTETGCEVLTGFRREAIRA
jgi:Xaa-Pro dipeptidase